MKPVSVTKPSNVPSSPGVYEFVDRAGRVLYVGKAKNLAKRLASYFRADVAARTARLVNQADTVRWILCATETEALVLEREWISIKQPPFNIRMRSGDGYSGIHVSHGLIPRLGVWRGKRPSGAATFGPYPGVSSGDLVDALQAVFGVRTCDEQTYRDAEAAQRACLLGETGRCLAPCVGDDEQRALHRARTDEMILHLRRPGATVRETVEARMHELADAQMFEAAAHVRDHAKALETLERRQRVVGPAGWAGDVVAYERDGERLTLVVVRVDGGGVVGVETYLSPDDPMLDETEILEAALPTVAELRLPAIAVVASASSRKPRGDRQRGLLTFAKAQLAEAGTRSTPLIVADSATMAETLAHMAARLGVTGPIRRIECVDISHTRGRHTSGSLVTLVDGQPRHDQFRVAHLRDVEGDDYAAIGELVRRRLRGRRMGLPALADLLIIDGGPGQVEAARRAMAETGFRPANDQDDSDTQLATGPVLIGLAKRFEEIWPVRAQRPLTLPADDPVLLMLQRARDHAHRHALDSNRRRRERAALRTGLDDIPGVGPSRRKALLARFGTLDAVARAGLDELAATAGIGPTLAERMVAFFTDGAAHPNTGRMSGDGVDNPS